MRRSPDVYGHASHRRRARPGAVGQAQDGVVVDAAQSLCPLTNHRPSGDSAMSPPGCGKTSGPPSVSTTFRVEATS